MSPKGLISDGKLRTFLFYFAMIATSMGIFYYIQHQGASLTDPAAVAHQSEAPGEKMNAFDMDTGQQHFVQRRWTKRRVGGDDWRGNRHGR